MHKGRLAREVVCETNVIETANMFAVRSAHRERNSSFHPEFLRRVWKIFLGDFSESTRYVRIDNRTLEFLRSISSRRLGIIAVLYVWPRVFVLYQPAFPL